MWILGLMTAAAFSMLAESRATDSWSCQPAGQVAQLVDLPEASGLAASRAVPGRLRIHNDSGAPDVFAVDSGGRMQGRVTLRAASQECGTY